MPLRRSKTLSIPHLSASLFLIHVVQLLFHVSIFAVVGGEPVYKVAERGTPYASCSDLVDCATIGSSLECGQAAAKLGGLWAGRTVTNMNLANSAPGCTLINSNTIWFNAHTAVTFTCASANQKCACRCTCQSGTQVVGNICSDCAMGKFSTGTGSCHNCEAGKSTSSTGSTSEGSCQNCEAGKSSVAGSVCKTSCSSNVANSDKASGVADLVGLEGDQFLVTCVQNYHIDASTTETSGTATCGTNGEFNSIVCVADAIYKVAERDTPYASCSDLVGCATIGTNFECGQAAARLGGLWAGRTTDNYNIANSAPGCILVNSHTASVMLWFNAHTAVTFTCASANQKCACRCTCQSGTQVVGNICSDCAMGKFSTGTGSCHNCEAGKSTSSTGSTSEGSCQNCEAGKSSVAGSVCKTSCSSNVANSDKASGVADLVGVEGDVLVVTCLPNFHIDGHTTTNGTATCGTNGEFNGIVCVADNPTW